MIINNIKKLISTVIATIFLVNGVKVTKVEALTVDEVKAEIELPNITPIPEKISINDGALSLTTMVNIIGTEVADEDALRILYKFLEVNNVGINQSFKEYSTTLIIGEVEDEITEMDKAKEKLGITETSELKEEGYVLAVESEECKGGTILIEGKDGDGTFYGVKTLTQLAVNTEGAVEFKDVVIKDEPTMKTRGILEGFQGELWTHEERLDQLKFYGDYKMNTYIYGHKEDPYYRTRWRQLHPEGEITKINELVENAKDNKVDFIFAISPGIDISFDGDAGEKDFQALLNKCNSLYDIGVRSFAIFFDDISKREGIKQAKLLNRFNEEFIKKKGDVKPLITIPTEYNTFDMNSGGSISKYTKEFSSTLDKDIVVMWTGSRKVPEGVDLENAKLVNSIYGNRMGMLWNYPANDYMKDKLPLGPVYNVENTLEDEIDFFIMKPMEHAYMSKIALATGADYSWNTSEYDYDASWRNVIEMLYGDLAPEMTNFANHSSRMSITGRADASEVKAKMNQLIAKLAKGEDAKIEIEYLRNEFDNMIIAKDTLKEALPLEILQECSENLEKLKVLGEYGNFALDFLIAQAEENTEEITRLKNLLNASMERLNSGMKDSEGTTLAFIKDAVAIGLNPVASFDVSSTFVKPGQDVTFTNTSSASSSEVEWIFEGANIESSTEEKQTVTYKEEGIYSATLIAKNMLGEDKMVKKNIVTVSNNADKKVSNLSLSKTVTTSSFTNQSEGSEYAIDGSMGTKWSVFGEGTHTLTIDLGKVSTITNILIKHAGAGGEAKSMNTNDYRIQVNEDGDSFVEVANVKCNEKDITNDKIKVINGRYVRLLIDKPTQGADLISSIFEVEVVGIDESVELPTEYSSGRSTIVYPTPQKTQFISKEGMSLIGEVNVVVHGEQDEATSKKIEEILKENNIAYVMTEDIESSKANIIITSDKEHCNQCIDEELLEDIALNNKEGYVLKATDNVNSKGNITIVGADKDGAYYGVLSLGQILEKTQYNKFAEVIVSDYPDIEFRGFIEGFYGTPWSKEGRISLMEGTSEYKMNTYVYAAMNDSYRSSDWKKLYPKEEAKEIKALAEAGKENNINFCWTINPGGTLQFTDSDFKATVRKFEQLYDLGVRQFGVLFDNTDDWSGGRQQAEWINKIDKEFVKEKGDVLPLIVISPRNNSAWGPVISEYLKPFMQTLNEDIQVMWTGHATMSNVSREVFQWPKQQIDVDKEMAVWWNYPVNDSCDSRLLMAPLHNLSTDLDNVSGFFSNSMNQPEASKVVLYSIADYTWNTDDFRYMESWETSIEKLVPEIKEEFKRFASNISYLKDDGGASGPFEYDESGYLEDKINKLQDDIDNNKPITESANSLLEEFKLMVADYDSIVNNIENDNLLLEIQVFLDSYKALGEAGVNALEALIKAEEGNVNGWLRNYNIANEKLELMNEYKVERKELENGQEITKEYIVSVGEKRLQPIVKEVIATSNNIIAKAITVTPSPAKLITDLDGLEERIISFEKGNYSITDSMELKLEKGNYVGIALPNAMKIGEVLIKANSYDNIAIEYSINGLEWKEAITEVTENGLKNTEPLEGTFVRILNKGEIPKEMIINSFEVKPVYKAKINISQNISHYQGYTIDKAIDGNIDTKFWSNKPSGNGHYIQLDFGKKIPLYDFKAYFENTGYMRNTEFAISEDGVNWTSLGDIKYSDQDGKKVAATNAEGRMAQYLRINAKGDNEGYWVQLYEVEFNKTLADFGDDYVKLVSGTTEGKYEALYDGDLATAFQGKTVVDELVYKMTRITNVEQLLFLQDIDNICEAKVSVKDVSGKWSEVGMLNKQLTSINVNKEIVEVKLEFNKEKPLSKIYEIIIKEKLN